MRVLQLTPGAGAMYCGNCLRDNALVAALRQLGHEVLLVPLYLPLTLDEADQSAGTPIFFSGLNVYLEQHLPVFRRAPLWLQRWLASPRLLRWAASQAARTRPAALGALTLSMLQGEQGNQARELETLLAWLKTQPRPDVICLSNALLLGVARRLKKELKAPLLCSLQGEDSFLDALPAEHRSRCWQTLRERAAEVDLFVAPSRYFAERMCQRLQLPSGRVRVVYNGIRLEGYPDPQSPRPAAPAAGSPTIGFFARMCPDKGLDTLVTAFIGLSRRGTIPGLKLRIGGSCGPAERPFVEALRDKLQTAGLGGQVDWCPNLERAAKLAFFQSLSVFSVPAVYGEAFGLYVLEALAAAVPVVQPRSGAFPELIEALGGGGLCAPGDPKALAGALESLLLHPEQARALGRAGQRAVFEKFSAQAMARAMGAVYEEVIQQTLGHSCER